MSSDCGWKVRSFGYSEQHQHRVKGTQSEGRDAEIVQRETLQGRYKTTMSHGGNKIITVYFKGHYCPKNNKM